MAGGLGIIRACCTQPAVTVRPVPNLVAPSLNLLSSQFPLLWRFELSRFLKFTDVSYHQ